MAKTNKEIAALIERVKEHNTKQKVAAENNKPVIDRINEGIAELKAYDLESPRMKPYADDIRKALESIDSLLSGSFFDSYQQKLKDKEDAVELLHKIVDGMYTAMEDALNESQQ